MPALRHPFIVVSHRGDHTHAPENTLAAFANAIKAGADYVEIDLRTTAARSGV
jgi:glycerophosphoryl diester phosphodiesterase